MTKQVTFWKRNQQWFDIFARKITDNHKLPLTSFINKSLYCWCSSLRCLPCSHHICWPQKSFAWCKDFILPTVMTLTARMQVVYIDMNQTQPNPFNIAVRMQSYRDMPGDKCRFTFWVLPFNGGNILMCGSQIVSLQIRKTITCKWYDPRNQSTKENSAPNPSIKQLWNSASWKTFYLCTPSYKGNYIFTC